MGANGSYNKTLGRVRGKSRTHREFCRRVDGHKVLLQNKNSRQVKVPMNSNSEAPIYALARVNKKGTVEIVAVSINKNHKCVGQIDLKFDSNGEFIPFNKDNKNSSHYHDFSQSTDGKNVGRKSHDKGNVHAIDNKYDSLIKKIVEFKKKGYNEKGQPTQRS